MISALLWMFCLCVSPVRAGGGGTSLDGISLVVHTGDPRTDAAQRRALAVLGADFTGTTHVAAYNYYVNPWVRDSFAWGMIPLLNDASISSYPTTELRYWLARPQPFGGWLTARKSGYFDETPILISSVLDAYQITGDASLVKRSLPALERGWRWLADGYIRPDKGSSVLLYANVPPHVAADWADQVARHGYATQLEALWYWATRSLGIMERITNHAEKAHFFATFAGHIRTDINRILWVKSAPYAYNAPAVAPFGHYRSWVGRHEYFELDSNYLCILYGIADHLQAASINHFVEAHAPYLLGLGGATGVPARVLYGDYARADYAGKHSRLGPGRYQSAYWPTVGSLVALGMVYSGQPREARAVIDRLSETIISSGDVREWYADGGAANGAPTFGWAARMFLIALFGAYLGVDSYEDERAGQVDTGLRVHPSAGNGSANLTFHARTIVVAVSGSGAHAHLSIGGTLISGTFIPAHLLCAGCTLHVTWSG